MPVLLAFCGYTTTKILTNYFLLKQYQNIWINKYIYKFEIKCIYINIFVTF